MQNTHVISFWSTRALLDLFLKSHNIFSSENRKNFTQCIFKNTKYIINRRILRVLFIQGTFSTKQFVNSGMGIVASIK